MRGDSLKIIYFKTNVRRSQTSENALQLSTSVDSTVNTLYNVCAVPWGVFSTVGDIMSTVGDIMSTVGGYLEYRGGCSVPWGIS